MSKSKVHDDKEARKLDEYYAETLNQTKPYILELKNPETTRICQKWIEKLNYASNQRTLRNQYLEELYQKLKSGRVEGIFCTLPLKGPLPPVPYRHQSVAEPESLSDGSEFSQIHYTSKTPWMRCRQANWSKISSQRCETDSTTSQEEKSTPKGQFSFEHKPSRIQLNICKQRIDDLTNIVKELQMQNEHLDRELAKRQSCGDEVHHLRAIIKQKSGEISDLRSRLVKVQQMKQDLEGYREEIVHQCKSAVSEQFDKFKSKLMQEEVKNGELQMEINTLTEKVEDILCEKREEVETLKKKYEELLQEKGKEFNSKYEDLQLINQQLKEKNEFNEKEIRELHQKVRELENKLQLKIEEETKLQTLLSEQYSTMKEEFLKIRNEMEAANQKQNQALVEKVSALKRSLLKMEKSKQKAIMEYKEQFFEFAKNKEVEIKTLQLQLQHQHNQLSTSLSTEKQYELDSLLNMLEEKYKGLLASTEAIADTQRQKYLQKMTTLEDQLNRLRSTLVNSGTYV